MGKGFVIAGVVCAGFALLTQLPASWLAALFAPKEIRETLRVSGTAWSGRIDGIQGLGPIDFQTYPLNFFSKEPLLHFNSQVPGFRAAGLARDNQLSDVALQGRVSTFSVIDNRLAGLGGEFTFTLDELAFDKGCKSASGRVSTNVLGVNQGQWNWQGPDLSGPVLCENGDLVLQMSGRDEYQSINVTVRSALAGLYTSSIVIITQDPAAAFVLPLYGFEQTENGYSLTETGTWN